MRNPSPKSINLGEFDAYVKISGYTELIEILASNRRSLATVGKRFSLYTSRNHENSQNNSRADNVCSGGS